MASFSNSLHPRDDAHPPIKLICNEEYAKETRRVIYADSRVVAASHAINMKRRSSATILIQLYKDTSNGVVRAAMNVSAQCTTGNVKSLGSF